MSPLKSVLVASVVLLSSFSFAQVRGEVVIQSRDGKAVVGRVITETAKGYLLATASGTQVVEFGDIADIRQLAPVAPAAPAVAPVAPAPMPEVQVVPVKSVGSSATAWSEVPPPPPSRPVDDALEVEAPVVRPLNRDRRGFQFGLGLNTALAVPVDSSNSLGSSVDVELQGVMDVNFGRPGYRLALGLGGSSRGFSPVTATVDNLFTFAFGDIYSVGAGLQLGALFGGNLYFQLSTVLQPVVLKLGARGQHQLSVTLAYSVLGNVHYPYSFSGSSSGYSYAGMLRTNLGYAFLF